MPPLRRVFRAAAPRGSRVRSVSWAAACFRRRATGRPVVNHIFASMEENVSIALWGCLVIVPDRVMVVVFVMKVRFFFSFFLSLCIFLLCVFYEFINGSVAERLNFVLLFF